MCSSDLGVNVDLAEVRAAAARIDPETAVLAVPDAEWGTRAPKKDKKDGKDEGK